MSNLTYYTYMANVGHKELFFLGGEIQHPPMSVEVRRDSGYYLWKLQMGEMLSMPISRPMPIIGSNCHELRIRDSKETWRIVYKIYTNAIVILEVFQKKTQTTPKRVIDTCKHRLKSFSNEV